MTDHDTIFKACREMKARFSHLNERGRSYTIGTKEHAEWCDYLALNALASRTATAKERRRATHAIAKYA